MNENKIEGTIPLPRVEGTIRQKSAFAVQHLMAAARFSRRCGEIEYQNKGKELGNFYNEQIACVSSTVMLACASMEANINEYFSEVETNFPELSNQLQQDAFNLVEKKSIIEKYQFALSFKGRNKLPTDKQPYQDARLLIKLRNALVHFNPEWHDEQDQHKKIENQLVGKFPINPFIGKNGVFFPQQCMSYGCTQWSVTSALNFMKRFSEVSGLPYRFEKFIEKVNPIYEKMT